MELSHTISGVTVYTKAPDHADGCENPDFQLSVNQYAITWKCTSCGVSASIERLSEPGMEDDVN